MDLIISAVTCRRLNNLQPLTRVSEAERSLAVLRYEVNSDSHASLNITPLTHKVHYK